MSLPAIVNVPGWRGEAFALIGVHRLVVPPRAVIVIPVARGEAVPESCPIFERAIRPARLAMRAAAGIPRRGLLAVIHTVAIWSEAGRARVAVIKAALAAPLALAIRAAARMAARRWGRHRRPAIIPAVFETSLRSPVTRSAVAGAAIAPRPAPLIASHRWSRLPTTTVKHRRAAPAIARRIEAPTPRPALEVSSRPAGSTPVLALISELAPLAAAAFVGIVAQPLASLGGHLAEPGDDPLSRLGRHVAEPGAPSPIPPLFPVSGLTIVTAHSAAALLRPPSILRSSAVAPIRAVVRTPFRTPFRTTIVALNAEFHPPALTRRGRVLASVRRWGGCGRPLGLGRGGPGECQEGGGKGVSDHG